jgi:hypothetical protein
MATKKETVDLQKVYDKLVELTNQLIEATEKLVDIKDDTELTIAGAGFKAGQAYAIVDKVAEELEELSDEIDYKINP